MNPILLDFYDKKNMRSLSSSQYEEAEATKTKLLLSASPFSALTDSVVMDSLSTIKSNTVNELYNYYLVFLNGMKSSLARELTVQELKSLKSYFYSMVYDNLT